jgi:hypothetical protein
MTNCLHCGATTSNGLALCELSQMAASKAMEFLPVYFRNLARWRPGRAGTRDVPGSRVLYDGTTRHQDSTGDRISDRLDEVLTALTTWARALVDDRGDFPRPLTLADAVLCDDLPADMAEHLIDNRAEAVTWLCAALDHHLTSIATLEWCGEFVRELERHEETLRGLTETLVPGWYAGGCTRRLTMEGVCGHPTYVVPGLTWVTCQACGSTTYARDHLAAVLNEARDWVARPKAIAEAIVALVDTEGSVPKLYTRIRQWAHHKQLPAIKRTVRDHVYDDEADAIVVAEVEVGYARYRFGDALDLTLSNAPSAEQSQAS